MRITILLILLALAGCTSTRDIETQGESWLGGGYIEKELKDGFFYIEVRTNSAPWGNRSAAEKMLKSRLQSIFSNLSYTVIEKKYDVYEQFVGVKGHKISRIVAYVLSNESILSEEEAKDLIPSSHKPSIIDPAIADKDSSNKVELATPGAAAPFVVSL